jgi:hypothetical protein
MFAATTGSVPALAVTPLWSGDFDTGDLSQWSKQDVAQGSTLEVVEKPVREGEHAMRVTVVPGGLSNNGNRAEVVLTDPIFREGDERWFHWYTLFPADFVTSSKWHLYTQWHSDGDGVPLQFNLHGETLSFRVMGHQYDHEEDWAGGILWRKPLQLEQWNEYLLHVRFSDRDNVGFVELWVDGKLAVPKKMHKTLDPGNYAYLKFGLYRDRTIGWNQSIYHDGMRVYASDPRKTPADEGTSGVGAPDAGSAGLGGPNPPMESAPPEAVKPGGSGCGSGPVASVGLFLPVGFAFLGMRRIGRGRRRAKSD